MRSKEFNLIRGTLLERVFGVNLTTRRPKIEPCWSICLHWQALPIASCRFPIVLIVSVIAARSGAGSRAHGYLLRHRHYHNLFYLRGARARLLRILKLGAEVDMRGRGVVETTRQATRSNQFDDGSA